MPRVTAGACAGLLAFVLSCEQRAGDLAARVTGIAGGAQVFRYGSATWDALDTADYVSFGDSVRILGDAYLELTFGDGNTIRFDENSKASFSDVMDTTGRRVIEVFTHYGMTLATIERLPEPYSMFRVRTPDAVADAAGTQFSVRYELHTRSSEIDVLSGEVVVCGPPERDTVVAAVTVPAGHGVVVAWRGPIPVPERIGLIKWKRLDRVTEPSFAVRRPAVTLVYRPPAPRRLRRAPPGHFRQPRALAPVPAPGRPVVKGRPGHAPRVLRPIARPKTRPAVKPGRRPGPAVKQHKPAPYRSRPAPPTGKKKAPAKKGGKRK